MKKGKIIEVDEISDKELTERYGSNSRFSINSCFKVNDHYYCQKNGFILHVKNDIINSLHNSSLDNEKYKTITHEEFENVLLIAIFNLGIYEYTKTLK